MPDSTLKFKCTGYSLLYREICNTWFGFQEARTEKTEGKFIDIYCPKCGEYVERLSHVVAGRSGMNVEKNGFPESPKDPHLALKYVMGKMKGKSPPPWSGNDTRVNNRNTIGVEGPFDGRGDSSPQMLRYLHGNRDIWEVTAQATRRVSKKKNCIRRG
jgi:hypothetical protein